MRKKSRNVRFRVWNLTLRSCIWEETWDRDLRIEICIDIHPLCILGMFHIYIAEIYFELWASKNEKKASSWSLQNVSLNFKWFVDPPNQKKSEKKSHNHFFANPDHQKKSRLIRLFFQISGAFDAPYRVLRTPLHVERSLILAYKS